jgi:hypothetical protein
MVVRKQEFIKDFCGMIERTLNAEIDAPEDFEGKYLSEAMDILVEKSKHVESVMNWPGHR